MKRSAWVQVVLMLGAFALAFQLGAVGAIAQDADNDGFSDAIENIGIALPQGMTLATGETSLPKCGSPRDKCIDPAKQDFFVIIKRATSPCSSSCGDPCGQPLFGTSDIAQPDQYTNVYGTTYGPLQWVSGIATGFSTHEILQTSGTSQVIGPTPPEGGWYAVKIIEDLNPCSSYMGISTPGTPTATSSATVWPEKIMNWIDKGCSQACFTPKNGPTTCYYVPVPGVSVPAGYVAANTAFPNATFTCKNYNNPNLEPINMKASTLDLGPLYNDFVKNIISHEASHMIHLAYGSGTSADHHWPIAYGYLMEQSIQTKATKDRNNNIVVTLYISTGYTNQDKTQYGLK